MSAFTLSTWHRDELLTCKKSWVLRCWCGRLSGVKCRSFAYGPADATASTLSLASLLSTICRSASRANGNWFDGFFHTDLRAVKITIKSVFQFDNFSTKCNIYILCLCYDVSFLCLSVTEVHWRIIANLGFKFRSNFTAHCVAGRGHLNNNISRYASHC